MRRFATALVIAAIAAPGTMAAQQSAPADWKWRQDAPAPLAAGAKIEPGSWVFVQMPPGWHVTTGPGVLLYPSSHGDVAGNFAVEAEVFLFPGDSAEEYGVFVAGVNVDGSAPADYVAFVLRRDGQAAVLERRAGSATAIVPWQAHDAIVAYKAGPDAVKNVIRVDVDAATATMTVNGARVLSVPRQRVTGDGRFGFRIGKDMNLHISALNVTRKLAPQPPQKN